MQKFHSTAFLLSQIVTQSYSSSFFAATSTMDKLIRDAIFSIYGFVRFADEIVDSFHEHDKAYLLQKFEADYYEAYKQNISLNPILHAFQLTVKKYNISDKHIQAFLKSMKADLKKKDYSKEEISEYIYGSADVVGLMCLKVFCLGDEKLYQELEKPAMHLGSAFQKVNFLRDLKDDTNNLNRHYFPELNGEKFTDSIKLKIVRDIELDFEEAYKGILALPESARVAVHAAYLFYSALLRQIKNTPAEIILKQRISVPNHKKAYYLFKAKILNQLKLV